MVTHAHKARTRKAEERTSVQGPAVLGYTARPVSKADTNRIVKKY